MATSAKKKAPAKAAKSSKSQKTVSEASSKSKRLRTKDSRFLGWQLTPVTQASFGATTRGGSQNLKFKVLHSTGTVQTAEPRWFLVDASVAPVGRLATTIASILMGKYRPTFSRGAGAGDAVVVINASKAFFTSNKADRIVYYHHSGFMGGLKSRTAAQLLQTKPEKVLWMAVQGMMPKTKLSRYQLSLLKIYKGAEHPHGTQKPTAVEFAKPLKKIKAAV